jgi:hypothetical protein
LKNVLTALVLMFAGASNVNLCGGGGGVVVVVVVCVARAVER